MIPDSSTCVFTREYSLLEGAVRLKKLPGLCERAGMPAVAVTDTNNMFAALEFSVTASGGGHPADHGLPDGSGICRGPRPASAASRPAPVVLLAQNERGYENLMKLNSCLYLRGDGQLPHVTRGSRAPRPGG